jgi:tetratricopeptide (TPR) repeat protein
MPSKTFLSTGGARNSQAVGDVIAAMLVGDYKKASQLADGALAQGERHPVLYNARALAFQQQGRFRQALEEFMQAGAIAPNDPNIQNAIGVCLLNLNEPIEAIRAFEATIVLDPSNAQAYYRKGWTLEMLGDTREARRFFERVIELDPRHPDALASLAGSIAVAGDTKKAEALAKRALAVNAKQPTAIVALGIVDLEAKNYAAAEERFRAVVDNPLLTSRARAVVHGLLADALHGLGRTDEAFAAYTFEKNEIRKLYAPNYAGETRPQETANRITALLEASSAENWTTPKETGGVGPRPVRHAFLLGFPRSGTTLLEQVLASSPQVKALEEQDFLADDAQTYLTTEEGFRRLASLDGDELARLRNNYWKRVGEHGVDVEGKTFVDKLPMHTAKLPLIAKLFPDARIIFSLRDPRDVMLSCYRRHFRINSVMFEFLTLEGAAELYAATMRLGAAAREKLPLAFLDYRYEDMVSDFDKSTAAVCEFIGIETPEAMREFHRTETGLDVHSPSAAQSRRPPNPDSVDIWRSYASHLAPVAPILEPWIERFGYSQG